MGINAIYFGPIFQSSYHGYDTIDYLKIDDRLGTNSDFKNIVSKLHDNNIRVIIDGVFNHVGREFWAFVDVKNNKFNKRLWLKKGGRFNKFRSKKRRNIWIYWT